MDLVEHIGSGMNRILKVYDRSIFKLSEHFLEVVFPFEPDYLVTSEQVTTEVTTEVTREVTTEVKRILSAISGEMSRLKLQEHINLKNDEHFRKHYLFPALSDGLIEMTVPDKPNSRLQKYKLTAKGVELKKQLAGMVNKE
jgi:hypothetical protein